MVKPQSRYHPERLLLKANNRIPMSMSEVAAMVGGITRQRAHQIERKALIKIARIIAEYREGNP